MSEEWRKVSGFDGYEVSSNGRVRSWLPIRNFAKPPDKPRILKFGKDKDGYHKVRLRRNRSHVDCRAAVLVAVAWHGERPDGMVVRHLDGSKTNDTPENLKWGTPKENSQDAKLHGTLRMGEKVNHSRLTEDVVVGILKSDESHTKVAKKYGVTPAAIWHIRNRRSWKHVSV